MKTGFFPNIFNELRSRLKSESLSFIQVVLGPRQIGKSTGTKWVLSSLKQELNASFHYCTADDPLSASSDWIIDQWMIAKNYSSY